MGKKLKRLKINEVALVPEGAGKLADIKLFKQRKETKMPFTIDDLPEEHREEVKKLLKEKEDALAEKDVLLGQKDTEISKLKAPAETDEEKIAKALPPELLAKFEEEATKRKELEKELARERAIRKEREAIAKVKDTYPHIADSEALASIYIALDSDQETLAKVEKVLTAVDTKLGAVDTELTKELGRPENDDEDSYESVLEKEATKLVSEGVCANKPAAYLHLTKTRKELFARG